MVDTTRRPVTTLRASEMQTSFSPETNGSTMAWIRDLRVGAVTSSAIPVTTTLQPVRATGSISSASKARTPPSAAAANRVPSDVRSTNVSSRTPKATGTTAGSADSVKTTRPTTALDSRSMESSRVRDSNDRDSPGMTRIVRLSAFPKTGPKVPSRGGHCLYQPADAGPKFVVSTQTCAGTTSGNGRRNV